VGQLFVEVKTMWIFHVGVFPLSEMRATILLADNPVNRVFFDALDCRYTAFFPVSC
jgi:hypothetical protein